MQYIVILLIAVLALLVIAIGIVCSQRRHRTPSSAGEQPIAPVQAWRGARTPPAQPMPNALVVGDVPHPDIVVQLYAPQVEDRLEPLTLHQEHLNGLEALVRHVPALALAGANMTAQTYVVRFAPEIASQLALGSATLMRSLDGGVRAIAIGTNGQIIGQGILVAQTGLGFAAAATAIWQVLAVVTAQYYLVGINHTLAAIEEQLDAVRARMDDQEAATLVNNFKRLRSIQAALADGRLTDLDVQSFVATVDTIDGECGRIMETCLIGMERGHQRLRTMNLQGTFDPADEVSAARRQVQDYTHSAEVWSMAALARVAAAEVRCALPVDRGIAQRRLRETQDELQRWETSRQAFTDLIRKRVRHVSTTIHLKWWEHDHDYRLRLLEAAKETKSTLNKSSKAVARGLVDVTEFITVQQTLEGQPLNLLVDVNTAGNITTVRQLIVGEVAVIQSTAVVPDVHEVR
jgi:hypothetical protein